METTHQIGELLHGLEPRMRAVALRFTRDREAARDVVQSAFEKALRHRTQFAGRARFSTWVHRIVANEALMWIRSETRRGRGRDEDGRNAPREALDPSPSPYEVARRAEARARLHSGLAKLRPDERRVVVACHLEGQSYEEFAREEGQHPAAVKSRAFRARRRLAAVIEAASR
jgi:RNA polymerase sigma-70 factor (ECF subfamily)